MDNFSDINSQDDALTREKKEQSQGLRSGLLNMKTQIVTKASSLIQTTGSALVNLTRNATVVEETKGGGVDSTPDKLKTSTTMLKNDDPDNISEDEQKRIMAMIEQEDDTSSEEEDQDEDDAD